MAFNALINTIAPLPTPADWVRPADWITITDTANEVQFLVCDTGAKAFTIRTTFTRSSGNIYIDWGDGVIDTITTTSSTDTSHVYSTGGTPCSRGYNTFKIRIYGDATCVIKNAQHISNFSVTGGSNYYCIGLLEAYFGNNVCNDNTLFSSYFYSTNAANLGFGGFQLLEYVKFPANVSYTGQLQNFFQDCPNLYMVVMPTSASSLNNLINTFQNCVNLLDISIPSNATAITNLGSAFSGCNNLRTVSLPTSLNSCTTLSSTFSACRSLKNITLPSINACTSLNRTFFSCSALQWIKFTSLPAPASAGTAVDCTSMCQTSSMLQNVYFPDSCSSNAIYNFSSAFTSCTVLKNMLYPLNFRASSFQNTHNQNFALTNLTFRSDMPNLTAMGNLVNSCYNLISITLPTSVSSSGIDLSGAFSTTYSLTSVVIPSTYLITNLNSTFNSCFAKTITLPNNAQNSISSLNNTFSGAYNLRNLVLPTSMTAVNTLAGTFSGCINLTSVTLPATMNAVTTMANCFQFCSSLTSVTLPTSMTACTNFSTVFNGCYSLISLTMPTTVSTSNTTYLSLVFTCPNLKTLTLPTTQTSLVNTISTMFSSCGNLTTINNLDKVGSLTATPLVDGTMTNGGFSWVNQLTSMTFSCPFSILRLNGSSTTQNFNKLNSLRLLNASAGQWTGASPQINVSFCNLSTAALNTLFADIAAQGNVVSKTINITSCTGAAGLTPANRLVLTSRGWTITG